MSEGKPQQAGAEEPFLERWSRRKSLARTDAVAGTDEAPAAVEAPPEPGSAPGEPVLPDIESLDEGSDYSAFLSPKVDEGLRRQALRKLFHSPKFNVCDGLDDYCGDYTQFDALGDIVTADLRHQLERAARAAERLAEEVPKKTADRATAASVAADADDRPEDDATGTERDGERPEPA